jgi:integrase
MRTTFPKDNGETAAAPKDSPNISGQLDNEYEQDVKYPKRLRLRGKGKVWATIYKRPDCYRLYWRARVDGRPRSMFKDFGSYSEAKRKGDKVVADLAKGNLSAALSPGQASDALAALQRLQSFYQSTGRRVSLLAAVSEFCGFAEKLPGRSFSEVAEAYLSTVAVVRRKDLAQAVENFIAADEPRTKAGDGERAELCAKYAGGRATMLRRFAGMFQNTAVCDLGKPLVDQFFKDLGKIPSQSRNRKAATSAKSRNHYRAAIRQFLAWAVRKDYITANHRLLEADSLRPQKGNDAKIQFYTAPELKALLDTATGSMRAMIAIGGLAGLRTAELLRLDWEDTRRCDGYIEVTSGKAKTRARRLVEIVPALAQWLAPYGELSGRIWQGHEVTFQQHFNKLCDEATFETKGHKVAVKRKPNGLRHSFCTYHMAAHGSEGETALQAGNSPQMLFAHYRGLATKAEGQAWFAVTPAQPGNVIPLATAEAK